MPLGQGGLTIQRVLVQLKSEVLNIFGALLLDEFRLMGGLVGFVTDSSEIIAMAGNSFGKYPVYECVT